MGVITYPNGDKALLTANRIGQYMTGFANRYGGATNNGIFLVFQNFANNNRVVKIRKIYGNTTFDGVATATPIWAGFDLLVYGQTGPIASTITTASALPRMNKRKTDPASCLSFGANAYSTDPGDNGNPITVQPQIFYSSRMSMSLTGKSLSYSVQFREPDFDYDGLHLSPSHALVGRTMTHGGTAAPAGFGICMSIEWDEYALT